MVHCEYYCRSVCKSCGKSESSIKKNNTISLIEQSFEGYDKNENVLKETYKRSLNEEIDWNYEGLVHV